MNSYGSFSYVYDTFMDETPYDAWKDYIVSILKSEKIDDGLILDLGCGTGTLTEMLADEGYDMIGVDASFDMLSVANEKLSKLDEDKAAAIMYLCQDMREFELYGTVRAVVSVCDCINYLLEEDDIVETFRLVNNYLDKEGLFIFDFNTIYKYRDVIGDRVIAENREDCSFIWDNYFDEESSVNEYQLTIFVQTSDGSGLYERYEEEHYQRGYELSKIKELLLKAGMEFVEAFDTDILVEEGTKVINADSQRITVVAKEKYQEGKLYINE